MSTKAAAPSSGAQDWSAAQYLKFERERTRPATDLLSQIPRKQPQRIIDLGCGPGNSTAVLAEQFPQAHISGVDSSPDMLSQARKRLPSIDFSLADLTTFRPTDSADLLFSNAVFQWLPHEGRLALLADLMRTQRAGGVFAFQVPDNFEEPTHVAMREVAAQAPWADKLRRVDLFRRPFQAPRELYDALKPLCADLDIWRTSYHHVLDDHQAVVEWVRGTGLRPYLDPLDPAERDAFLQAYLRRIRTLYPPLHDGKVCLRYPRLFVVAVRA